MTYKQNLVNFLFVPPIYRERKTKNMGNCKKERCKKLLELWRKIVIFGTFNEIFLENLDLILTSRGSISEYAGIKRTSS